MSNMVLQGPKRDEHGAPLQSAWFTRPDRGNLWESIDRSNSGLWHGGARDNLEGMGETTKTPLYPRPRDLDARVYAAFMGHAPQIRPPERLRLEAWQKWPVLREWNGPRWERLRRACSESVLSPHVRERLAPLLAQAKRRWAEARERLINGIERTKGRATREASSGARGHWSLK